MKDRLNVLLLIFMLLVFCSFAFAQNENPASTSKTQAPDFQLRDMDGNQVILSNYRDKEPVLLFFWTTWCPYCRIDLKTINAKYEELSRDGLKVLPINVGEPTNRVKNLLKNYNLVFKVLLDKDAKVAYAYGLSGVPTYVLIDKKGNIVSMGYQFPQKEYKAIISK